MSPILFIHIPKTAGTSLNASATQVFGNAAVERDYGPSEPHTTDNVKKYIYSAQTVDQYGFREATRDAETRWITGHFPADRFLHLFGAQNTITFLRDPVERVLSEYQHLVRHGRVDRDLETFYRSEPEINKQHHMVGLFPWKAYHLVGSQDTYAQSVALLAQNLNLPFEALEKNVKPASEKDPFDAAIREEIRALNNLDYQLVDEARLYLDKQFYVAKRHEAFCYHDVAFESDVHFIGWAFFADNEFPVNIQLWVDGDHKETAQASEHRPELQAVGTPRMGHNGFRFVLDAYKGCDSVELRTQETDQLLFSWARS